MTASRRGACPLSQCDVINWLLRHSRKQIAISERHVIGKRIKYPPIHAENKTKVTV